MKSTLMLLTALVLSIGNLTAQWSQVSNFQVPATISGADLDGSTLYAATTDNGFYKSTNNGASWTKLGLDVFYYYPVTIKASGSTVVALPDYESYLGIQFSTDGGQNFQQGATFQGWEPSFIVDGHNVYVFCEEGLLHSTDDGATLTNTNLLPAGYSYGQIVQTPVGFILVATNYDYDNNFVGNFAYRSIDGVNWTDITGTGGSNPLPSAAYDVSYTSAGYSNGAILAGMYNWQGTGALYKSTDLGENWSAVSPDVFVDYADISATNDARAYVSNWDGIQSSTDLNMWTNVGSQVNAVYDASGSTFVGRNQSNQMVLSTNNGASWQPTTGGITGRDIVTKYVKAGNNTFVGTMYNGLFRSGSNGYTKVLSSGQNSGGNFIWDVLKKGNTLLAGVNDFNGGQAGIFRSTDNGQTWANTNAGTSCYSLYDDNNAIYAGVNQGVLKSTDNGQTWTAMNNGLPSRRLTQAFVRVGNTLMAGLSRNGIYTSTDNGANWTQKWAGISGLFGRQVNCFVKMGSTVLAGTQYGILRSTDEGETWSFIQNDVLNEAVHCMVVGPDEVLYIGTGLHGMYSSTDEGETLESHNDGADDNIFVSTLARDGGQIYAGWNIYDLNVINPFIFFGAPASWGRLLWSETPSNLHNSDDRGKSASAPAALGLTIFPNPVQDVLRFNTNVDPGQISGIELINAKGERVRNLLKDEYASEINVRDLPRGAYFLRLIMLDGKQLTQRFIIQGNR